VRSVPFLLLAALVVVLAAPVESRAQTRLTVLGGGLVPFGDLSDITEASLRGGARLEYQPVNALGKRRLLSWFLQGIYSPLEVKSEVKDPLEQAGQDGDASLLTVDAGIRAYSKVAPLFLQAGAGWTRYSPPGPGSSQDAFDFHAGAGFLIPIPLLYLEADVTIHQAIGSNDLSFTYAAANAGVSLPF
jgi:hypothetical protein